MHNALRSFFSTFLDLLAPPRHTETVVAALTPTDLEEYPADEPLPYRDEAVRALIWELKYRKNPKAAELAGSYLAEKLVAIAAEELGKPLLIPAPMHEKRRHERGYNQTEFLCSAALPYMKAAFEYAPIALVRIRHTAPQQGLPKHVRLKNIKNSMAVLNPEKIKGRVCVVVDDVTTTGATFAECKRALKVAGARSVHCVALARS